MTVYGSLDISFVSKTCLKPLLRNHKIILNIGSHPFPLTSDVAYYDCLSKSVQVLVNALPNNLKTAPYVNAPPAIAPREITDSEYTKRSIATGLCTGWIGVRSNNRYLIHTSVYCTSRLIFHRR